MPSHVRELLLLLGCGYVPTLDSVAKLRWEHPSLPDWIESSESASEIVRGIGKRTEEPKCQS